jgi:hypothetical protein
MAHIETVADRQCGGEDAADAAEIHERLIRGLREHEGKSLHAHCQHRGSDFGQI